ncbi:MAG: tetratricopeptide repeat protein [Bacteroidota bacterium]
MKYAFSLLLLLPLTLWAQPTRYLLLADSLFRSGKFEPCIEACDEQLKTHFEQTKAYLLKARSYIEMGHYILAIDELNSCIKRDKKNAAAYALRAYCQFMNKDYKLSRLDLIEACYLDTGNALYHYNLGNIEQHMKKYSEACKSYALAIKYKPEYAEAYSNRGFINLERYEFTEALMDIDSALKYNRNGSNEELFLYRGMTLSALKKNKEAIEMFNRCISMKPNHAAAYYNRGRAYYQIKNFKPAIANFDTAIALKPKFDIAYFNRALAKMELDKHNKKTACDDLGKAIQLGFLEALPYLKKYCE